MNWIIDIGTNTLTKVVGIGRAFLMLTGALIAFPQWKNVR